MSIIVIFCTRIACTVHMHSPIYSALLAFPLLHIVLAIVEYIFNGAVTNFTNIPISRNAIVVLTTNQHVHL